jgi:hypothetical protein
MQKALILIVLAYFPVFGQVFAPAPIPETAVTFFNQSTPCPAGWEEYTLTQGRYVVGLNPGGALEATVGTALSIDEDRPFGQHSHTVSETAHTHTITESGHSHTQVQLAYSGGATGVQNAAPTATYPGATTTGTTGSATALPYWTDWTTAGNVTSNSAGTATTNAPYIQLRGCRKLPEPFLIGAQVFLSVQIPYKYRNQLFYTTLTSCPSGSSDSGSTGGFYLTGLLPGDNVVNGIGTYLSDQENRATGAHTHTIAAVNHQHSITETAHTHPYTQYTSAASNTYQAGVNANISFTQGYTTYGTSVTPSVSSVAPVLSLASYGVAGTNAPYVQLRLCKWN